MHTSFYFCFIGAFVFAPLTAGCGGAREDETRRCFEDTGFCIGVTPGGTKIAAYFVASGREAAAAAGGSTPDAVDEDAAVAAAVRRFGSPISRAYEDGVTTVQWFQKARIEWNHATERVTLGAVGIELLNVLGPIGPNDTDALARTFANDDASTRDAQQDMVTAARKAGCAVHSTLERERDAPGLAMAQSWFAICGGAAVREDHTLGVAFGCIPQKTGDERCGPEVNVVHPNFFARMREEGGAPLSPTSATEGDHALSVYGAAWSQAIDIGKYDATMCEAPVNVSQFEKMAVREAIASGHGGAVADACKLLLTLPFTTTLGAGATDPAAISWGQIFANRIVVYRPNRPKGDRFDALPIGARVLEARRASVEAVSATALVPDGRD